MIHQMYLDATKVQNTSQIALYSLILIIPVYIAPIDPTWHNGTGGGPHFLAGDGGLWGLSSPLRYTQDFRGSPLPCVLYCFRVLSFLVFKGGLYTAG